jgi:hypothetical protein
MLTAQRIQSFVLFPTMKVPVHTWVILCVRIVYELSILDSGSLNNNGLRSRVSVKATVSRTHSIGEIKGMEREYASSK